MKLKFIYVVITTVSCSDSGAIKGKYENGYLHINIRYIPDLIYVLIDGLFSANDAERCLGLLREKLCACEELIIKGYVMRYDNHAPTDYFIGGLKENLEECFRAIPYNITCSLHKLN